MSGNGKDARMENICSKLTRLKYGMLKKCAIKTRRHEIDGKTLSRFVNGIKVEMKTVKMGVDSTEGFMICFKNIH